MVRKITLRHPISFDPIEFAIKHFDKERFRQLAEAIQARLDEKLEIEDEDSQRSEELKAYRNRLSEMAA